ncbi:MAG TPA: four helix bundle protein [Gemmataceae bacterium]|nr:four helix bundle protein [Gemmataceae bacterium]
MDSDELKRRTKEFAKRIIRLCRELPNAEEGRLVRGQLFRAGTSVGSNYRAACRGRSKAEFISKLGVVLEETDESLYWLELIVETEMMKRDRLEALMDEANQLSAIWVASLNTAKQGRSD